MKYINIVYVYEYKLKNKWGYFSHTVAHTVAGTIATYPVNLMFAMNLPALVEPGSFC